ncbi:MAG: AAA family ATPase [Bacteroidales bacterium]|nr:AAA family ATPase [Bacteroidales bacterium]
MIIQLPTKKGTPNSNPTIDIEQLVIVGANGSGKTRFGSDLEERYFKKTHRISAQKSLSMPTYVGTKSKEVAYSEFKYGVWNKDNNEWNQTVGWKHHRWGNNLNTFLLNDYEKLMVLLHTEEYEQSLLYKETGGQKPNTKLDRIQRIFENALPHRRLIKKAGVIEIYPPGSVANNYNASEMSDGERVIFYLAGEVVCAPENSIIIIDEPEMHIHRSLVKKLFDLIENERPDCSFIYLTHDIDFAFTRQNAIKVWAKSYEGENVWDYEILDENVPIPEQLLLEILGSRKPIIFLEGDNSSIDYELYEQVYADYTIKPLGSCEKVIQTVKAFNEQIGFHHLQSFGIIDRDRKPAIDLPKLNLKNIWVLDVAEAENLLLSEGIVRSVSNHMGRNPDDVFSQVKTNLISFFSIQLESQILLHYKEILRRSLLQLSDFAAKDIAASILEIDNLYSSIDKQRIYNETKAIFDAVISSKDYDAVLRLFNLKNALIPQSKVCDLTGIKNKEEYLKLVISLLKRNDTTSTIIKKTIDDKIIKNAT